MYAAHKRQTMRMQERCISCAVLRIEAATLQRNNAPRSRHRALSFTISPANAAIIITIINDLDQKMLGWSPVLLSHYDKALEKTRGTIYI